MKQKDIKRITDEVKDTLKMEGVMGALLTYYSDKKVVEISAIRTPTTNDMLDKQYSKPVCLNITHWWYVHSMRGVEKWCETLSAKEHK